MTSPAFQFYPNDWLSSPRIARMTAEQEGAYIRLLCYDWSGDGIPDDSSAIAQLSRVKAELLGPVMDCFVPHPKKDGYLTNPRLQEERRKQEKYRKERSQSGLRGAKSRWLSHSSANGSAIKEPMAKNGSSSSSSSSSSEVPPNPLRGNGRFKPTAQTLRIQLEAIESELGQFGYDATGCVISGDRERYRELIRKKKAVKSSMVELT